MIDETLTISELSDDELYFFAAVGFNEAETKFMNDLGSEMQKHESHDQSTHGSWATDGSYPTEAVVSDSTWEAVHNYTNRGYKYLNVALNGIGS
jgi:hypothetical protein